MRLTPKLAFIFVLFAAVIFIGVNAMGFRRGQDVLRSTTIHELEAIAGEKEAALEGWIAERQVTVESFANSPSFRSDVDTYKKFGPAAKYPYEHTVEYIRAQCGIHFDPRVVECFLHIVPHFEVKEIPEAM